ncbi:MAG: alpha/beta hydrolase [Archangium sp.]|nr:alpha/beta hydrolase [Archangium sp.]MDP3573636.1 alpha/beta hydrolase [Archangium sp.]
MKRVALVTFVLLIALIALVWEPDRPVESLTARWAPPPSQFVEVNGLRVHLRDVGPRDDALPIVLLHGTSASLHTWEGWVAALESKHRVISLDLPGFGLTGPFADGDESIQRTLQLLTSLLAQLKVERCVLAGNSYGGRLAWELAVARPELVHRLVLVDAAGYPRNSTSVPLGFRIAATPGLRRLAEVLLPRALIERSVQNVYGDPSKVTPGLVDRYFELTLRAGNRAALGRRIAQQREGETAKLEALSTPTLILWGGQDRLIPPENAQRFHADLPHSTLIMFEALGHVPQEEDPAATVAEVVKFLD